MTTFAWCKCGTNKISQELASDVTPPPLIKKEANLRVTQLIENIYQFNLIVSQGENNKFLTKLYFSSK